MLLMPKRHESSFRGLQSQAESAQLDGQSHPSFVAIAVWPKPWLHVQDVAFFSKLTALSRFRCQRPSLETQDELREACSILQNRRASVREYPFPVSVRIIQWHPARASWRRTERRRNCRKLLAHSGVRILVSSGIESVRKRGSCKGMHIRVCVSFAMKPLRT